MCTIACPGVSLTLLAVAWHCGFALRVFMKVLSHWWIEGLTTHHRWRRQLLFFNATQSWRTLLWFLKKTEQINTSNKKKKLFITLQKSTWTLDRIHVRARKWNWPFWGPEEGTGGLNHTERFEGNASWAGRGYLACVLSKKRHQLICKHL